MSLPVIGILQVGLQGMADRYTYLPMIGIAFALAWTVRDWARGRPLRRVFCGLSQRGRAGRAGGLRLAADGLSATAAAVGADD